MISLRDLRAAMVGARVVFDEKGAVLDMKTPFPGGLAVLMVTPVTDALKRLEGERVVDSIDRDQTWRVDAMVLGREVLERLGDGSMSAEDLLVAVPAAGYEWEVSPTSAP